MVTLEQVRRKLGPGVEFYCEHFHAPEGAQIALWGPSGCGKSTMLNLISGLLRPSSGVIKIGEHETQRLSNGQLDQGKFNEEKKSVTHRIGVHEFTFETENKVEWTPPADAKKLTPVQFRKFLGDSVNQHYTPQALSTLKAARSVPVHEQFSIGKAKPLAAPAVTPVIHKLDPEAIRPEEMAIRKH